jgi:hypothetical protein
MAKTIQSKKAPSSETPPRKFKYTPYVGVNLGDRDLTPIYISLPTPPADHLIDGYGLPPEEQYFRRLSIPPKLTNLHSRVIDELKAEYNDNTNRRVSDWKIYLRFWDYLERDRDHYEAEILFIKHVWWYRTYGYFCWVNGEIMFLPPDYYDYLNYFTMLDVVETQGFPEYRDKDRRKYTFMWYLENTCETFAELDAHGRAVKHNGRYEMCDVGSRVFYGMVEPKTRRSGATYQAVHKILKTCMTGTGKFGTIVSFDGDNAGVHWTKKFLPGWWGYPIYLKPISPSQRNSNSVRFGLPSGVYGIETLESIATYTESAGERKNDGDKIHVILSDEGGKGDGNIDIGERWRVNKLAMSTGGGSKIWGSLALHPSTVEDMDAGGLMYQRLCDQSNFYERLQSKGQTHSGLARCFFPGDDGMEGYIDKFGMSVISSPTEQQIKLRSDAVFAKSNKGSKQMIEEEFDALLASGTPVDMATYRSLKRKTPMCYADCWRGESGNSGFNIEKIETRIAELRRLELTHNSPIIRGYFKRTGTEVSWITDPENGRFEIWRKMPEGLRNQKKKVPVYNPIKDITEMQYAPMGNNHIIVSADVFGFDTQSVAKMREGRSRQSDGGISAFWDHDSKMEETEDITKWISYTFILSYRYRPNSLVDFHEDVLCTCLYLSAPLYAESNKADSLLEFFLREGFGGYFLYDVDPVTGKRKNKPGFFSLESTKNELFGQTKDYIEYRCHQEKFMSYLVELRDTRGVEDMRNRDRMTAHGGCLLGLRALRTSTPSDSIGVDLGSLSMFRKRQY